MNKRKILSLICFVCLFSFVLCSSAYAQNNVPVPNISISVGDAANPNQVATSLQLLFLVSIIAIAPSLLLMFTSFTRIIICIHFLRSALGTQQMPPNQVLVGLALILTLFQMSTVFAQINQDAFIPYTNGQINQREAIERGLEPLRGYMFRQVENKDMALFSTLSGEEIDSENLDAIPTRVLLPAYLLGEITKGFRFGFIVYLPFIVIDMVVASTLMAMGMMMLPPAMISLPFKILLFVMADGWSLVIGNIMRTFK